MSIRLSSARRHSMLKRGAAAARLIAIAIAVSLAAALLALTAAMLLIVLALLAVVLAFLAFSRFRAVPTAWRAADIVIKSDYVVVDEGRRTAP
jgi:hypothetical protein